MTNINIAIIGGGIAGLACARRLRDARHDVTVFEKARGAGGRLSTRRVEVDGHTIRIDHGAQYITTRHENFSMLLGMMERMGAASRWQAPIAILDAEGRRIGTDDARDKTRWRGAIGMSDLPRTLSEGLTIKPGARVAMLMRDNQHWTLGFEDGGEATGFDWVITATPAEQAVALLQPHDAALAAEAEEARSAPCWATLIVTRGRIPLEHDAVRVEGAGPIAWAARQRALPEGYDAMILHADHGWSKDHLELDKDDAATRMRAHLEVLAGPLPDIAYLAGHRWRYALVETAAQSPFAWNREMGLAAIGDWRLGPRVESAWLSGDLLGEALGRL